MVANSGGIGVAISTRHGSRLTHRVSHGHLSLLNVLVLVLLIQSIAIEVVGEFLSVENLVDGIIQLRLPLRLISTRLVRKLRLKCRLCRRYGLALLIGSVLEIIVLEILGGGVCLVIVEVIVGKVLVLKASSHSSCRIGRCSVCRLGCRGVCCVGFEQCSPSVGANNTINVKPVLLLVVFDSRLRFRTKNAILCQLIAVLVKGLLQLLYIATRRPVFNLKCHSIFSSLKNVLCPKVDISIDPFDRLPTAWGCTRQPMHRINVHSPGGRYTDRCNASSTIGIPNGTQGIYIIFGFEW